MVLLIPLIFTVLGVRITANFFAQRDSRLARSWTSWEAPLAAGMSLVYVCTSVAHFIEPQRSGLVAIVPPFIPEPELMVTLTGITELVLAAGLLMPKTRRWAALASIGLLMALFPANIIAAGGGVSHPAAPSTPLVPRIILQTIFITSSAIVYFRRPRKSASRLSNMPPRKGETIR